MFASICMKKENKEVLSLETNEHIARFIHLPFFPAVHIHKIMLGNDHFKLHDSLGHTQFICAFLYS
jgi:hypothetical protein